ncbi:MAG: 30S ribosomal protein S4e [Methanomicrobiales archaeon]|nr:30S ribosomal protein S4e [Methanomicrobiales archaeon]MDI6875944.1 30S ribosomal protein S4e [Methanomicrobiales archaeon]
MGNYRKRLTAPDAWRIRKKTSAWVTKTSPGPHDRNAMPIAVWLRDRMGLARTMHEVKQILNQRAVIVNGRAVTDPGLGIGIFDVVSLPGIHKHYRVLVDEKGNLVTREIGEEDARMRLAKIRGKTIVPGGRVQLNLSFGANILADNTYRPGDSIVIALDESERFRILEHYPFGIGAYALVIGGRHAGMVGRIVEIATVPGSVPNRVVLEGEGGMGRFDTIGTYVFVIGRDAAAARRWGVVES